MITHDPRYLRNGAVRLEAGATAVVRATGADRIGFLHRVTTGSVQATPAGQSCRSLFLDNKAHVLADLRISVGKDDVRLTALGGDAQALVAGLGRYAVMDDFTLAEEPGLRPVVLYGPEAAQTLRTAGVTWAENLQADGAHAEAASRFGPLWLLRLDAMGTTGLWAFAGGATATALDTALQTVPVLDGEVAEAARILAGEPKLGAEITPDVFPMEVGLARALDSKKGCYLGQETIVRMRDRGLVRKRLVALRLRGDTMPPAGSIIAFSGQDAGHLTSVARLPGETPVALALLSTTAPLGAEVHIRHAEQALPAEVFFERAPWG